VNIENMLKQLKEILPPQNFKNQPTAARDELLEFEKTYNINTSQFIEDKEKITSIPEEVREEWITTLDTFINFNGSIEDINHLSTLESSLEDPFIITSKEDSKKEYIKKKSKETFWLPCFSLFLNLNNFINIQSLFGMEQKSGIGA
jgi:hypothetical protein